MKEIYTGYKDMDGREYKVGDIVLNTFFGDYWVVAKNKKNEREDCEYRLLLYNNEKEYYMDLNEPSKLKIIASKGEKEYKDLLKEINKIKRDRNLRDSKFFKIIKALFETLLYFLCISIVLLLTMWFPFIMGTILILLIAVVVFIHFYSQD